MISKKVRKIRLFFTFGILISILVACSGKATTAPIPTSAPIIATETLSPVQFTPVPFTPSATSTPIFPLSPTPDLTQQAWHSTAVAYQVTDSAATKKYWDNMATRHAQFSITCDTDMSIFNSLISQNGEWIAYLCGNKHRQKLIVENKNGKKWILKPEDVFNSDEHYGGLKPVFWDPEGEYLYIGRSLGFSGGGDECFPSAEYYVGYYGYFQLNLNNGSWVTILPQTNRFPGYDMQFSPTGRRYAINVDGITIADFKTGDVAKLDVRGVVVDLGWSPDGRYLAYFVATCDESGRIKSSSVYTWDSKTSQVQLLFTVEKFVLYLESWVDDSTLRVLARKLVKTEDVRIVNAMNVCPCFNYVYDVYTYDIATGNNILSGTATPYP